MTTFNVKVFERSESPTQLLPFDRLWPNVSWLPVKHQRESVEPIRSQDFNIQSWRLSLFKLSIWKVLSFSTYRDSCQKTLRLDSSSGRATDWALGLAWLLGLSLNLAIESDSKPMPWCHSSSGRSKPSSNLNLSARLESLIVKNWGRSNPQLLIRE